MAEHRGNSEKVSLFRSRFVDHCLGHVHGTYDPRTGKAFQVKEPITDDTILRHLRGIAPLGVYLLVEDRTGMVVIDFDREDANPPLEFVAHSRHYGIPAYLERSKGKGWHVHIIFCEPVLAAKARLVSRHILDEIGQTQVEIFPKQDALDTQVRYGNFINLPLFWRWVNVERTVFVDDNLIPYPNQWDYLEGLQLADETQLDWVIEMNDLKIPQCYEVHPANAADDRANGGGKFNMGWGLPPCAQRMLSEGVTFNQRIAAFRLAIQLRKTGLGEDLAVAVLQTWAAKNRPVEGKTIITRREIQDQVRDAFRRLDLRGCGCSDETVNAFCDEGCPIYIKSHGDDESRERSV